MCGPSSDKPILLLENEFLIALDIVEILTEAGFGLVVHKMSCTEADGWLKDNTPALGILDIHLGDGQSDTVARTLVARNVPFIVHSGSNPAYSEADEIFQMGRWVSKPIAPGDLLTTVQELLALHGKVE